VPGRSPNVFYQIVANFMPSRRLYNQSMWKDVLALGLQDSRVMSAMQTVWNVTAESHNILVR
jgi:hypothetical protein